MTSSSSLSLLLERDSGRRKRVNATNAQCEEEEIHVNKAEWPEKMSQWEERGERDGKGRFCYAFAVRMGERERESEVCE